MFPLPIIFNTFVNPPPPDNLIFGLYDFYTISDIQDRSINNIPVDVTGDIGIGSNEFGTFMDFKRIPSQYITATSQLINVPEYDLEVVFSDPVIESGDSFILDTRSTSQGEQTILSLRAGPAILTQAGGNAGDVSVQTNIPSSGLIIYRLEVRSTGVNIFINGVLKTASSAAHPTLSNGFIMFGRSNYTTTSSTLLYAKIYSLKIFAV